MTQLAKEDNSRETEKARRLSVASRSSRGSVASNKEDRFNRYLKSKPTVLKAIYQQPCIPNTPPKLKTKSSASRIVKLNGEAEDALDGEIDKYSAKVDKLQADPRELSKKTEHPDQSSKRKTLERQAKDRYLQSVFAKKSPQLLKSNVSDRSKFSKVRFADQADDQWPADKLHEDIFDAEDGAGRLGSVYSEEISEDDPPVVIPPRKKAYIDLSYKNSKFQKREKRLRNEEQELFGPVQESCDDQTSQASQISQLRSDTFSLRSQVGTKIRPSSAQVKRNIGHVHGINASRF